MKSNVLKQFSLVFLFVSMASTTAMAVTTEYDAVEQIRVFSTDATEEAKTAQIVLDSVSHSCGSSSSRTYRLDMPGEESMLKLAEMAYLSGRKINLSYNCSGDTAEVWGVRIEQAQ